MLSKLFFSEAIKILSNFVCYIFKGCSQFICIGVSNFSKGAKMQILSIAYLVIEHTCKFPGALLCIHTVLEPQHPQAVSYNRPPCLKKKKPADMAQLHHCLIQQLISRNDHEDILYWPALYLSQLTKTPIPYNKIEGMNEAWIKITELPITDLWSITNTFDRGC